VKRSPLDTHIDMQLIYDTMMRKERVKDKVLL